jgi:hypothetical protein
MQRARGLVHASVPHQGVDELKMAKTQVVQARRAFAHGGSGCDS